jgi:rod shape-determining protein MreC
MLVLPGEKIDFGITYPLQIEESDLPAVEEQPAVDAPVTPSEESN